MSNKYLLPIIIAITILTTGAVALTQFWKPNNDKVAMVSSSSVVGQSSVIQVVSRSISVSSNVLASSTIPVVASVPKVENSKIAESIQTTGRNEIPTFDSINKANIKLSSSYEITAITIGKCNLETKFKTGLCDILDQGSKTIAKIYSASGFPLLINRTGETQKIITLVRAYGACSLTEYEFNFKTNYFSVSKSLVSPGCTDNSVIEEIEKYEDTYYQNSEK
jgi:hypothetical protein